MADGYAKQMQSKILFKTGKGVRCRLPAAVVNVTNRGLTDNHRDSTRGPNAAGHTRSFRTDTDTRELLTK